MQLRINGDRISAWSILKMIGWFAGVVWIISSFRFEVKSLGKSQIETQKQITELQKIQTETITRIDTLADVVRETYDTLHAADEETQYRIDDLEMDRRASEPVLKRNPPDRRTTREQR